MAEPQLHLADASWLGAEQWLDVGAPSHPSGSDSATGILPVEPVSSDGRTDAFQRQAIEQQSQVAPYDPQQYAAALDMHCPFGRPALLAEENQASFEPLDHGSFTLGFGTTDYYPMVPFMEGHAPPSILSWGQSHFASTTEPPSAFAGPSSLPAVIAAPPNVGQERFTCTAGCNKTFGRAGDWRRHMGKHASHKFRCIMIDCDKTFYRKDKLKAHVKQGHKVEW
jgi:uncharacterized Zn-finger protein